MKRVVLAAFPLVVNLAEMNQAQEITSHFKQVDHVHQHVLYDELRQRHQVRKEKPVDAWTVEAVAEVV